MFKKPGEAAPQDQDGYRIADLEGANIVISAVEMGESVTKYSDGELKPHVDCDVLPLDGPYKGTYKRSRFFGGYLISDLRGLGKADMVLGRVEKGVPRPGLREGWLLREVDDPKITKAAEAAMLQSAPF